MIRSQQEVDEHGEQHRQMCALGYDLFVFTLETLIARFESEGLTCRDCQQDAIRRSFAAVMLDFVVCNYACDLLGRVISPDEIEKLAGVLHRDDHYRRAVEATVPQVLEALGRDCACTCTNLRTLFNEEHADG